MLTLRGSLSYRSENRVFGGSPERGGRLTWLGEAALQGSAGIHTWVVGGAIQQDHYGNQDLPAFDYSFVSPGLFLQDEVAIAHRLTLGLSARIDHHSSYGTFASPRISLLYKPAEGLTARLSAGTGFFAPTPFVEETEETGFSRLKPLQGLVAERARSASVDASWRRGRVEVVGTIFGSQVRDPVERKLLPPEQIELANADGPVRTWGTELLASYRVEGLVLLATHNFTRSTEQNPELPGRRDVPLTPRHSSSLNAIWEGNSWGRLGLEAYYIGRQALEDNPYAETGRGHFLFGALFERRIGRFRAFINLENLGDVRQTRWDPLVRPSQAPDGRWTVDAFAPLDGRVINGGIRLAF